MLSNKEYRIPVVGVKISVATIKNIPVYVLFSRHLQLLPSSFHLMLHLTFRFCSRFISQMAANSQRTFLVYRFRCLPALLPHQQRVWWNLADGVILSDQHGCDSIAIVALQRLLTRGCLRICSVLLSLDRLAVASLYTSFDLGVAFLCRLLSLFIAALRFLPRNSVLAAFW